MLKNLEIKGQKNRIDFRSSRSRLCVNARITVKPQTPTSLRDGTAEWCSFGVREEGRQLPQAYANLWPTMYDLIKTTLQLKQWKTPEPTMRPGIMHHHCSIEVPYVYAPATLPTGRLCSASEQNATKKRLCIALEVSEPL